MKKWVKIIGGIGVLCIALVVALVAIISSQDFNQYKGLISEQAKAATGRTLTIDGNISLSISLTPTLAVEGLAFENAEWAEDKPYMLTAQKLEAEVSLIPLISGQVEVNRLVIRDLQANLTRAEDGRANWEFGGPAPVETKPASSSGAAKIPVVKEVDIRNLNVSFEDKVSGQKQSFQLDSLDMMADGADRPVSLDLAGKFNDFGFNGQGRLGSVSALASNASYPIDLKLDAGGVALTVQGSIAKPLEAKGLDLAIKVAAADLDGLKPLVGDGLPPLKNIDVRGQLTDPDGGYSFTGLVAQVGNSHVTADASVLLSGPRPKITLDAVAKRIDLSDFLDGKPTQETQTAPRDKVFPSNPLPFDAMKTVDAEAAVLVQEILGLPVAPRDIRVALKLDSGVLQVKPLKVALGGGAISATADVNGAAARPSISITVDTDNVAIGQILADGNISDVVSGVPLNSDIRLSGEGESVAAIMGSLNGKVLVQGGEGKINNKAAGWAGGDLGTNIIGALHPMAARKEFSILHCAVIAVDIRDGLAVADKGIGMEGEAINLQGSAEVNLKTEALNASFRPSANEGLGFSLAEIGAGLVKVDGTLANPSVGVDAFGAAKAAAKVGAALATGGLSVLGSALVGDSADGQPCRTALGLKPVQKTKPKTRGSEPPPASGGSPADKLKEGLGGALKNLFGQ